MKQVWRTLIVGTLVAGSCMNVMGQETQSNTAITVNYEVQSANTNYLEINGQIYVPFKWLLNQVGIKDFKWENGKKGGNTKAYITVEVPALFWENYYGMLATTLISYSPEYEETLMPLPASLKALVNEEKPGNGQIAETSLNKRPIELTVTSEGYQSGEMIYNYKIVDGTLYLPVDEIQGYFGIENAYIDEVTHTAVVNYIPQDALKVKIEKETKKLEQILKLQNPEDVLSLWIRAQQSRNGALQYSMLCNDLKEKVLPEAKTRGWVTGGSSPSLRGGKVTIKNKEKVDENTMRYTVQYESMLQGKVYETLEQVVTMKSYEEDGKTYWCISQVTGDVGYYTFNNVTGEIMQ